MALKELIQDDMKTALLGGDRFVGNVLRDLKAAILNEEVAQGKRDDGLADAEIEKIIAREVKKRNESVRLYEENDRAELAENEKREIRVLEKYLPAQVSEDEIRNAADQIIADMDEPSMQQMGQVIGALKAKFGNSAEGSLVAKVVKEQLSNT